MLEPIAWIWRFQILFYFIFPLKWQMWWASFSTQKQNPLLKLHWVCFLVTKWQKICTQKNLLLPSGALLCSALLCSFSSYIWRLIYPPNTGDFIISSDSSCNKPRKGGAVMLVRPFLTICSSLTVSTSFSNERVTFCFCGKEFFCGVLLRDEGVEFFGCRNGSFD